MLIVLKDANTTLKLRHMGIAALIIGYIGFPLQSAHLIQLLFKIVIHNQVFFYHWKFSCKVANFDMCVCPFSWVGNRTLDYYENPDLFSGCISVLYLRSWFDKYTTKDEIAAGGK